MGDCVGYVWDMGVLKYVCQGGIGKCLGCAVCGKWGVWGVCIWCVYMGCVRCVCIVCGIRVGVCVCDMGAYVWWECICVYVGEWVCGVCMVCEYEGISMYVEASGVCVYGVGVWGVWVCWHEVRWGLEGWE